MLYYKSYRIIEGKTKLVFFDENENIIERPTKEQMNIAINDIYYIMNETEKKAFKYLIKKRCYSPNDIIFQRGDSPDFLTINDNKGFEVKLIQKNRYIDFAYDQFQLLKLQKNTEILVFNKHEECPVYIIHTIDLDLFINNKKEFKIYVRKPIHEIEMQNNINREEAYKLECATKMKYKNTYFDAIRHYIPCLKDKVQKQEIVYIKEYDIRNILGNEFKKKDLTTIYASLKYVLFHFDIIFQKILTATNGDNIFVFRLKTDNDKLSSTLEKFNKNEKIKKVIPWKYHKYAFAIQDHMTWIKKSIGESKDGCVRMKVKDLAKELGFETNNEMYIYQALKYVMFNEGVFVKTGTSKVGDKLFVMRLITRTDTLPPYLAKYGAHKYDPSQMIKSDRIDQLPNGTI